MRQKLSRGVKQKMLKTSENLSGWDLAIAEAERQISDAKQKIAGLNESISTFRALRDKGERFPEVPAANA